MCGAPVSSFGTAHGSFNVIELTPLSHPRKHTLTDATEIGAPPWRMRRATRQQGESVFLGDDDETEHNTQSHKTQQEAHGEHRRRTTDDDDDAREGTINIQPTHHKTDARTRQEQQGRLVFVAEAEEVHGTRTRQKNTHTYTIFLNTTHSITTHTFRAGVGPRRRTGAFAWNWTIGLECGIWYSHEFMNHG